MQSNVFVRSLKLNPSPQFKKTNMALFRIHREKNVPPIQCQSLLSHPIYWVPAPLSLPLASFLFSYASFHVSDMLNVKSQTTKIFNSEIYFVTVKTWLLFWILMQLSLYSVLNSWASLKWKISVNFLTISKLECLFIRNVSVPYDFVSKDEMCLTINKTFIYLTKIPIFIEAWIEAHWTPDFWLGKCSYPTQDENQLLFSYSVSYLLTYTPNILPSRVPRYASIKVHHVFWWDLLHN